MIMDYKIRVARKEDAEKLLKIYAPYVENTAITFEYTVPTKDEFEKRIENTLKKYPYIAAERNNEILDYAYAGELYHREAYMHSAETSIYVARDSRTVPYAVKNLRNISALSEFAIAFSENVWYNVVDEKFNGKRG